MKTLYAILWALIIALVVFGATHIQKQLNAEIDKRAEARNKEGWCTVDLSPSSATIECSRISKI